MLMPAERRIFARRAAGDEEIDARFHLPADECAQGRIIKRKIAPKRSHQRGAASRKHVSSCSVRVENHCPSNKASLNSNQPFLPITHLAAVSAPRAKPSRLRAVCRSVIVSAPESKPISCVPGCLPARLEPTSTGRAYPAFFISSTSFSSVPEGASFLVEW